ncbi:hypothetical protein MNBD_DELTA03-1108 [hydrothermal vent metagenome]|uniref:DUF748 domain-containing protein n=1 Tax=hydrothermal vent metagenome TaxID=652676 RepID=A0A3B0URY8_9ZZZZ
MAKKIGMVKNRQGLWQRFKGQSRFRRLTALIAAAFVFYLFCGFFILPPVVRIIAEKKLPLLVHRTVTIKKIRINPLTLSVDVEGFSLFKKNSTEKFIGFDKIAVNFQAISLVKRALIVKSLAIVKPTISFSRTGRTTFNFSDILSRPGSTGRAESSSSPLLFSLNNIEIKKGDIRFVDEPKGKKHHISDLNLALANISNLPYRIGHFVHPAFSAVINGTPFTLGGSTKPFAVSRDTKLNISISGLDVARYLTYLPVPTKVVPASCLLDIKGQLGYSQDSGGQAGTKLFFKGRLVFRNVVIRDHKHREYMRFPRISISLAKSNLLKGYIHTADLQITTPRLFMERTTTGMVLPFDLLRSKPVVRKRAAAATSKRGKFRLDIDNMLIDKAVVTFLDRKAGNFKTELAPLTFQLTDFKTIAGAVAGFNLRLKTEAAETISGRGSLRLFPSLSVSGTLAGNGIQLRKYMPYIQAAITPEISRGVFNFSTKFAVSRDKGGPLQALLGNINFSLNSLLVRNNGQTILTLPELKIKNGAVNLAGHQIHIENIISKDALTVGIIDGQGALNLAALLKKAAPERGAENNPKRGGSQGTNSGKTRPWAVSLISGKFSNYKFKLIDNSLRKPAKLFVHNINLKISDFSTGGPPAAIRFSSRFSMGGSLKAAGVFSPVRGFLKLKAAVSKLSFRPFQPYIGKYLNVAVDDGSLSGRGTVTLNYKDKDRPLVTFTGNSRIDSFKVLNKNDRSVLVRWHKLALTDIALRSAASKSGRNTPLSLNIAGINWEAPYANLILSKSGRLNLLELRAKPAPGDAHARSPHAQRVKVTVRPGRPPAAQVARPLIAVKKVVISHGTFEFSDQRIKPAYSASLTDFGGVINGLSSNPAVRAEVSLVGKFNQFSPVKLSGTINPLAKRLFADVAIKMHDIDLSPVSPYSGKYIGYKIAKGKLTLNLKYLVDDEEIKANNHIFLDQFTLGEAVKSPDASSLPIHLALALLKNRQGEITLNIPVQGNLKDPKFSVGGVVVKVIFNLIAKAATSPFALLSALIPSGDQLRYIPFEAGRADIPAPYLTKLAKIASVLYERPGLRMDIVGKVDPGRDLKAIKEFRFQKLLKIQKAKDEQGLFSKKKPLNLEKITISPKEYPRYLIMAYRAMLDKRDTRSRGAKVWSRFTSFVKGTAPGKNLSEAEIAARIIAGIKVPDDELRLLAHERATNVKKYLVDSGKIKAERLFVLEPEITPASAKKSPDGKKGGSMRAELVIK